MDVLNIPYQPKGMSDMDNIVCDIICYMKKEGETDVYYYDERVNLKFHLHLMSNGRDFTCMRRCGRSGITKDISWRAFSGSVRHCFYRTISADEYYTISNPQDPEGQPSK